MVESSAVGLGEGWIDVRDRQPGWEDLFSGDAGQVSSSHWYPPASEPAPDYPSDLPFAPRVAAKLLELPSRRRRIMGWSVSGSGYDLFDSLVLGAERLGWARRSEHRRAFGLLGRSVRFNSPHGDLTLAARLALNGTLRVRATVESYRSQLPWRIPGIRG